MAVLATRAKRTDRQLFYLALSKANIIFYGSPIFLDIEGRINYTWGSMAKLCLYIFIQCKDNITFRIFSIVLIYSS